MNNKTELIQTIKTGHIAEALLSYALLMGAKSVTMKQELWENKVDERWTIKCNGQDQEVNKIPPFSWYIEYNGWPAGSLSIFGDGVLCAGSEGNEDNLRAALLKGAFTELTTT